MKVSSGSSSSALMNNKQNRFIHTADGKIIQAIGILCSSIQ